MQTHYADPMLGSLPDPVTQAAFYDGTPIKRGIAWVIDFAVILALVVPIIVMTAFVGLFFLPFLIFTVGFIYRVITIANGSATLGMRLMAIEFRDAQGNRLDAGQAFLHTLGYTISFSIVLVQVASIVLMFVTERKQGLTDLMLGTVVLNKRA